MADFRVTHTRKDGDGDILALCNCGKNWRREKHLAINDIESGHHRYYVDIPGTGCVFIHVVWGANGKYLRTDPDRTTCNNLDDLPDC